MTAVHPGPVAPRRRTALRRVGPVALRALRELVLVALLFELYRLGRMLVRGQVGAAHAHAEQVHHLEQVLHLRCKSLAPFPSLAII